MGVRRLINQKDEVTSKEDADARGFAIAELIFNHIEEFRELHRKHLEMIASLRNHSFEGLYISSDEIAIKKVD